MLGCRRWSHTNSKLSAWSRLQRTRSWRIGKEDSCRHREVELDDHLPRTLLESRSLEEAGNREDEPDMTT